MFFFRQASSLWHVQQMRSALSLTLLLFLSFAFAFSLGWGWKAAWCAPPPPGSRWYCIVFGGFMFPPWKVEAWNDIDIYIRLDSNLRHMIRVNGLLLLLLLMHPRVHLLVLLGPTCNVGFLTRTRGIQNINRPAFGGLWPRFWGGLGPLCCAGV